MWGLSSAMHEHFFLSSSFFVEETKLIIVAKGLELGFCIMNISVSFDRGLRDLWNGMLPFLFSFIFILELILSLIDFFFNYKKPIVFLNLKINKKLN